MRHSRQAGVIKLHERVDSAQLHDSARAVALIARGWLIGMRWLYWLIWIFLECFPPDFNPAEFPPQFSQAVRKMPIIAQPD
jgi:hypothetical protein